MIPSLNHTLEAWVIDLYATNRLSDGVITWLVAWHPGIRRRAAIIWSLLKEPQTSESAIAAPTPDFSFLSPSVEKQHD